FMQQSRVDAPQGRSTALQDESGMLAANIIAEPNKRLTGAFLLSWAGGLGREADGAQSKQRRHADLAWGADQQNLVRAGAAVGHV
ncbi:hypothetical protein QR66_19110, partial [Chromobacterium piscinae]